MLRLATVTVIGIIASTNSFGAFAGSVVDYQKGIGFSPGFDKPVSALGEPSRVIPGEFGGPVDPFNAPYSSEQIVSVGTGGSLTIQFAAPVLNSSANSYDRDFIVFGNAGFVYSDFNLGITDGSLYGGNEGVTQLSVSADGITYYTLLGAPNVDSFFPTDGAGDFTMPLNTAVTPGMFTGQNLSGIRNLYAGSGGGTSYDISWAVNEQNQAVQLDSINFVRLSVLSGKIEVDGFAAVPEPSTFALGVMGTMLLLARRRN